MEEGQRYCNECQAAYMRGWRKRALERLKARARHEGAEEGAEALRVRIAELFEAQIGSQEITGLAAARIVRDLR